MTGDADAFRQRLVQRLGELSEIAAVSGQEGPVRRYVRERVAPFASWIEVDPLGNLLAWGRPAGDGAAPAPNAAGRAAGGSDGTGDAPGGGAWQSVDSVRVMLAAHMDEIGLVVTRVDDGGLVHFKKVGGIDDRILPGKAVEVGARRVPGVIGAKPRHLQEESERSRTTPAHDLFIDVGARDRREAEELAAPGDGVVFATAFQAFGDGLLKGRALDDRAGCAILMSVLEACRGPFAAAFTVQEEIGLRGARVAAWRLAPEYAIVLEGTPAADVPRDEGETPSTELGRGPAISFMDGSSIADAGLVATIRRIAEREGIPWQWRRTLGGGNDAGAIHLSREGVRAASISVPCRYIHGPAALCREDDLVHAARLARAVVEELLAHGADGA